MNDHVFKPFEQSHFLNTIQRWASGGVGKSSE
jgi:hypothetical protein